MYLNRAPEHMNQKLTQFKKEIDNSSIIMEGFNIWLSIMSRTTRQKIRKEI